MSERMNKTILGAAAVAPPKPVPMKLFATWEVDRTPSNCIPRLCSLTLTRLEVLRPLGNDLSSISIAVKMQSNKRILRSNEFTLPSNGLLDTGLELAFSLQYPHFLKRDGNHLHILLQRRKRYKNRTMLGFKTLAEGVIRMDQVLQKQMDIDLDLMAEGGGKEKASFPAARITISQLNSTPVDQEHKTERDRDFSDEEDEFSSGEEEPVDLSDSEPLRKLPHTRHNFKQRFVSLLKKFRMADTEEGRTAALPNPSDIQALFQELESLSCDDDSPGEQDTMSISSTPKPSLRPFFSSSRSLLDTPGGTHQELEQRSGDDKNCSGSDGNADLCGTDYEAQSDPQTGSPPRDRNILKFRGATDIDNLTEIMERKTKLFRTSASVTKKKHSLSASSSDQQGPGSTSPETITARKVFLEQVSRILPIEEAILPDCVVLISGPEPQATSLVPRLAPLHRIFQPTSAPEGRAVITTLFSKIQKYCNTCAKLSNPVKLLLIGGDHLVGWALRPYVDLMSTKPPDWLNYIKFYIVPFPSSSVARHLATLDSGYGALFPPDQDLKLDELSNRIQRYLATPTTNAPTAQLPLAEAMLNCQDDSMQQFVPFVNEVRVGPSDSALSISVDLEDLMCSSPPAPPPALTPPSSPNVQTRESPWEPLELQVDYWQLPRSSEKTDKNKQDGKTSLKALFRGLQATPGLSLTMHLASKEKKQKIMRLGKKKERELEAKSQCVDGISRLICSARASHTSPMRVLIDGAEWTGVKFFQLSSTWQTHVKQLSVALVGVPLACAD
ncbi:phosphofurin acidic cluster sorting protein 1 [Onthophagus taurus]|uniref:phosphofurin acidic cluster sorting protein 1 n=1 Tax=Onthophagus taurus TaxID=166361 RepID=UPI000C20A90E|nr:phosphofurin acidic cluster sorting protein 1 [Onthophagus taurus]